MASHYYIYYRVDPDKMQRCAPAARAVLATVRAGTGIAGRLLQKRGEPGLWMEVYEGVTDEASFELALAEAAGRYRIADFLQPGSMRRIERFAEFDAG